METTEMGRVVVEVRVKNLDDAWKARDGRLPPDQVRSLAIPDALVDSGASTLGLPTDMIRRLGLKLIRLRNIRSATGEGRLGWYEAVHLEVQGRDCVVEVMELPDGSPVLIGQIPLEIMDWVIDMKGHKLIGNPAHGGEWVTDMF